MRTAALLTALLLLVSPLAAPTAAAEPLLTDAQGDAQARAGGDPLPSAPAPGTESTNAVDLLALETTETQDDLTFTIRVAGIGDTFSQARYGVFFDWEGAKYLVGAFLFRSTGLGAEFRDARLYLADEDDDYRFVTRLTGHVDPAAGIVSVTVPKVNLVSPEGRVPVKGSTLEGLWVGASSSLFGGDLRIQGQSIRAEVADRMPDADAAALTLQEGNLATGHLLLETPDPVRVSNGGATTLVFEAHVHNDGSAEDEVDLAVVDLPEGWEAQVASPVKVPPGESRPAHVITTVPFKHVHGGFDGFNLTAKSRLDPAAEARARFGVLHTPIAMPAGHHPDLFLHATLRNSEPFSTLFPWTSQYMNTDPAHEEDVAETRPNDFRGDEIAWRIPLGPALAMGLDFDLDATGALVGSVIGRTQGEATVGATLYLTRGDEETVLAEAEEGAATLDLQNPSPFALTLTPTPDADYVPYAKDQNLVLELRLDNALFLCCMPQTTPTLVVKDFKLTLPLLEYHDRVTRDVAPEAPLELAPDGPTEKRTAPGATVGYAFVLKNKGLEAHRFLLNLTGPDASLATLTPGHHVDLAPGESKRILLGLQVPPEATEGQRFEVVLVARSADDPSALALGKTVTIAALHGAIEDEMADELRAAQNEAKDTPAWGAPGLLLAALAAALAAGRRRRGA